MLDNINANGIPNMPDFPTVEIHIQKDEAEMSTKLTSGWKDDEDDWVVSENIWDKQTNDTLI